MHFSFVPFLLAVYILLTWAVCALVLVGIGSLLLRPCVKSYRPLDAFWAGLFLAVLLLQLGHFLVPIGWPIPLSFAGLGLLGLLGNRRTFLSRGSQSANSTAATTHIARASLLWSLGITAAIALRCVGPCNHYDTGYYNATAVRWINTFPIVPGLANLMAQLGFNSSAFLCVAALNHGLWNGLAFHLFPGLLLSALVFAIVPAFFRVWRGESYSPSDLYLTILAIPGLFWATNSEIIGINADLPTTFLSLAAFHYLLAGLQPPGNSDHDTPVGLPLLMALLLFPLALSFKISSVVFAFLGWSLAFSQLWSLQLASRLRRNLILVAVLFPAVLLASWGLRGVILSGYPFFPSSSLGFPVDWRVPAAWADVQAQVVRSWARMPWGTLSETEGWHWFGGWLHAIVLNRADFILPVLFTVAGIVALLRRREVRARWLRIVAPSICGLAFWFWRAPAIRFGEPVIWNTAATLGAAALLAWLPGLRETRRRAVLAGFLVSAFWCSYPRTLWRAFYRPAFAQRELPRLPQVPVAPYRIDGNLSILVPYRKNQCWDSPLPCSPYFFDSLQLRRGSELRSGFLNPNASGDFDKSGALHKLYWTGPEPDRDHW